MVSNFLPKRATAFAVVFSVELIRYNYDVALYRQGVEASP